MTYAMLTSSPYFQSQALNEIRRTHPDLICLEQISPQHLLLKAPKTFDHLTRPFRNKLPIYLHHLFPVHRYFKLKGTRLDLERIIHEAHSLTQDDFTTQARVIGKLPYNAEEIMGSLDASLPDKTVVPSGRILSILVAEVNKRWYGYIGVSWANQNLSPYATGRPYYPVRIPNRAGLKLMEAIDSFGLRFRANDHALDLGAAPGAWTLLMRSYGLRVTSVAPSPLYEFLQDDAKIQHFPMLAEDFLSLCHECYDILLNDMILDAQDSAHLMVDYAAHLRSQGIAIMTVKLRLRKQRGILDHAMRILRQRYKIIQIRQLVSNRKEVTLFLRKHS